MKATQRMSMNTLPEQYVPDAVLQRLPTRVSGSGIFGNAFACLIPILLAVEIDLVGRLFLSEILLLCMLPFLLTLRGRLLLTPLPRKIIVLGIVWLFAQILTDVIRNTPFEDWSRGWSKIAFLLVNFSAIYLYLNRQDKRLLWFAVGIGIEQILVYFVNPNIYVEAYPWKFGYGPAITLFVVIASQSKIIAGKKLLAMLLVIGIGALNLYMGSRSVGVICFLTGWFVLLSQSNRFNVKEVNLREIAMLIVRLGVPIVGITLLYYYGASEGWLGENEYEKYATQSSGAWGVVVGGRNEILASTQAIIDSPIIGHGSWAKDAKYVEMLISTLYEQGYEIQFATDSTLIPTHSYIFGAWVESGLLGAVFWTFVLILTLRALIMTYSANSVMKPLIAFVGFNLLWHILFSPFGAEARLYTAYNLVLLIVAFPLSYHSTMDKRVI